MPASNERILGHKIKTGNPNGVRGEHLVDWLNQNLVGN